MIGSSRSVLLGGDVVFAQCFTPLELFKVLLEIGNTPAATRPRAPALADLTGTTRFIEPDVIHDLPFGNVKAVADFVVKFHGLARVFRSVGWVSARAASNARMGITGARIRISVQ